MSESVSRTDFGQSDVCALLARADWLASSGRYSDAEAVYRVAIATDATPRARSEFASFLFRTERLEEAAVEFRSLLDDARRSGDGRLCVVATHNLAAVHRAGGDSRTAADLQQRSLSAELQNGDAAAGDLSASSLSSVANDALLAGKYNIARKLLRRSLTLETVAGSLAGQAADWGSLGLVAICQARYQAALACLLRAYVRHRQLGDKYGMGCDLLNIAEAARRLGRTNASIRFLRRALAQFESIRATRQAQKTRLLLEQASRVAGVSSRDPLRN